MVDSTILMTWSVNSIFKIVKCVDLTLVFTCNSFMDLSQSYLFLLSQLFTSDFDPQENVYEIVCIYIEGLCAVYMLHMF